MQTMLALYGFHSENIFGKKLHVKENAILDHFDFFINCVLLRREHTIPYLLMVLLSIRLNKLP